jgi:hypothetical protein
MQGHACAQRVTDERARLVTHGTADRIVHEAGARGQVGSDSVRTPVPRQVDRDQSVGTGQLVTEATPEPSRLREPVQQGQWWPRTSQFDSEGHAG